MRNTFAWFGLSVVRADEFLSRCCADSRGLRAFVLHEDLAVAPDRLAVAEDQHAVHGPDDVDDEPLELVLGEAIPATDDDPLARECDGLSGSQSASVNASVTMSMTGITTVGFMALLLEAYA
jgi:hypothetical protein